MDYEMDHLNFTYRIEEGLRRENEKKKTKMYICTFFLVHHF